MIGTYVSAALICVAALLVGRALLLIAGRTSWSWLEPVVGFAAILQQMCESWSAASSAG